MVHISKANFKRTLRKKYKISTALIIEKPVSNPIVPPIVDRMSPNLAALSCVTFSKVGVSKKIRTYRKSAFTGGSVIDRLRLIF